jgi:hypothetical protein
MADTVSRDKEAPSDNGVGEIGEPAPVTEHALTSISGSLAALFLEKSLLKGRQASIPSLKIVLDKEDLYKP